jgi:hypothetical protein
MRFPPDTLTAVAEGRIDLAFRRWERPRAMEGGAQRTPVGVIGFESVQVVSREDVSDDEARRAGFSTRGELLAFLDHRIEGDIYRVQLRLAGPDPRIALRESIPDEHEAGEIEQRLARLDRLSTHGPWTRAVLEAIRDQPGRRAGDLAAEMDRPRLPFKADVRKLKELGLTESLEIGYRLSARGEAVLERLSGQAAPSTRTSTAKAGSLPRQRRRSSA